MGNFVTSGPNEAVVKFGCRGTSIHVGSTTFRWWVVESVERLDLGLMTLEIKSTDAETAKGVRVNITGIAQVKVKAFELHEDRKVHKPNEEAIQIAVNHFLSDSQETIRDSLRATLEGYQREILGGLTVEELYKDRNAFSQVVKDHVIPDLRALGFDLCSYVVTAVSDLDGYLDSLGVTQTAIVKREAEEGSAQHDASARKAVAGYNADANSEEAGISQRAHVSINSSRELEAESDRNLKLKRAAYNREVNQAQAEARNAYKIEEARQKQKLVREKALQNQVRETIRIEITDLTVKRSQREREGYSLARVLAQKHEATGVQILAKANAAKVRAFGEADADVTLAQGQAEADALRQKADAYDKFGKAAVIEMVVKQMPSIMEGLTKPLRQMKEMTFVATDDTGKNKNKNKNMKNKASAEPDSDRTSAGVPKSAFGKAKDKGEETEATL
ncbi:Flotillin-1 [Hondaea fermentalgiana]|uniref:Flotillin-1 n=1 Tax=Hondaea fermentalgiana TaxID=2315210 RepID=A0A2R5G1M4_9STRA|nr:Flotillin-1 [Hondaea fermentalgiana]|eukprot:GBG24892.1 Flotillin-1 [Hondaea fermentalgiana]